MKKPIALITGASSGIGNHIAMALLKDGYQVVLASRRLEQMRETLRHMDANPADTLAVKCDVTKVVEVKNLFQKAMEKFGRVDLLFNNAGTNIPALPMEEISYEQWRMVIDTNLTGAFLCTQEAFKVMKHQDPPGGRIINNGSISAHVPRPFSAPYTASKHGISGLTKSTALDGRKYNIACGQIDIGNAATEMAEKMNSGVPQADGRIAIEPTINVKHVTEALLYMAGLPLDANIPTLTVMATQMPFVGRG